MHARIHALFSTYCSASACASQWNSLGHIIRHLGLDTGTLQGSMWVPVDEVLQFNQLDEVLLDHCRRSIAAREVARRVGKLQAFCAACGAVAPAQFEPTSGLQHKKEQDRSAGVRASMQLSFFVVCQEKQAPPC